MAIFAFKHTKTLDLPLAFNDDGDTQQYVVTIRQLAPRHLEMAVKESQRKAFADLQALGGMKVLSELQEGVKAAGTTAPAVRDPLATFDRDVLIEKGVVSWTLGETPTAEHIAELSEDVSRWLATEILRLTKPSLLQTEDEAEGARKNG